MIRKLAGIIVLSFANVALFFMLLMMLAACAGSPAQDGDLTPQQYAYENFRGRTLDDICSQPRRTSLKGCLANYNSSNSSSFCQMSVQAFQLDMDRRGLPHNCCQARQECSRAENQTIEVYNIDTLRVTTEKTRDSICVSGNVYKIILEGTINPDSSFAVEKLLRQSPHCRNMRGDVVVATTVQLESGGGYLVDGYKLGRSLRRSGATTIIENQEGCASSCAVAFLGGKKRIVADTGAIMFHAPYFSGKNAYGEKLIDCDIPKADLQVLNDYYVEMVGKDAGDRIYERTMWYCSSEDGWVVTGGSGAELYDIATEK